MILCDINFEWEGIYIFFFKQLYSTFSKKKIKLYLHKLVGICFASRIKAHLRIRPNWLLLTKFFVSCTIHLGNMDIGLIFEQLGNQTKYEEEKKKREERFYTRLPKIKSCQTTFVMLRPCCCAGHTLRTKILFSIAIMSFIS